MGKGIDRFMSILSLNNDDDDDYDTDELFDNDIEQTEPKKKREKKEPKPAKEPVSKAAKPASTSTNLFTSAFSSSKSSSSYDDDDFEDDYSSSYSKKPVKSKTRSSQSKIVSMNGRGSELLVIKPQDFNESQTITEFLKEGKAIIINMEGIDLTEAQRIIDFVGGACFALEGSLKAISNNIFVAAPNDVEVSGDLREEMLGGLNVSPNLSAY